MEEARSYLAANMYSSSEFDVRDFLQVKQDKRLRNELVDDDGDDDTSKFNGSGPIPNLPYGYTENDLRDASGSIDWEDPSFGYIGGARFKDMAKFHQYNAFVIAGLPFKSPLFEYQVRGYKQVRQDKLLGKDVFQALKVQWKPLKLTKQMLSYLLDEFRSCKDPPDPDQVDVFMASCNPYKIEGNEHIYDPDAVLGMLCQCMDKRTMDQFVARPNVTRYYQHEYVNLLVPKYYGEYEILGMKWSDMPELVAKLKTEPHLLCFSKLVDNTYLVPEDLAKIAGGVLATSDAKVKLSELPFAAMIDAMNQFKDTNKTEFWHMIACMLYDEMKIHLKQRKHMYMEKQVLYQTYQMYISQMGNQARARFRTDADRKNIFYQALKWLVDLDIMTVDKADRVFLSNAYRWEMVIAKSIQYLFEKEAIAKALDMEAGDTGSQQYPDVKTLKTNSGHPLCREQAKAYLYHIKYPVIVVSGPGGSGKTDFSGCLRKLYPSDRLYAFAYQSNNVARLMENFPGRAFTIHNFLYTHRTTCLRASNPMRDRAERIAKEYLSKMEEVRDRMKKGLKPDPMLPVYREEDEEEDAKLDPRPALGTPEALLSLCKRSRLGTRYKICMCERITVAVVDEASILDSEIFSELLATLCCHGELEKLVIMGDWRQLASVNPGNVLKETFAALEEMGMAIEFRHNHRVNPESHLLKHNADAFWDGNYKAMKFDDNVATWIQVKNPFGDRSMDAIQQAIVRDMLQQHDVPEYEHHIITPTNSLKYKMVFPVEEHYHNKGYTRGAAPDYRKNCFWQGRKMMFRQNNYPLNVYNNEILILKRIEDFMVIELKNGSVRREVKLVPHTAVKLESGWDRNIVVSPLYNQEEERIIPWDDWAKKWFKRASVTTVHCFQGGQIHTIGVVLPYFPSKPTPYVTKEMIYTILTRPTHRFFGIGDVDVLRRAIDNPEPLRKSILKLMIIDICKSYKDQISHPDLSILEEIDEMGGAPVKLNTKKRQTDAYDVKDDSEHEDEDYSTLFGSPVLSQPEPANVIMVPKARSRAAEPEIIVPATPESSEDEEEEVILTRSQINDMDIACF
jgi:hypothetical protein